MNRYMAKLNVEHLPGSKPGGWEARSIEVPKAAPRRVRNPKRTGLPQIGNGDEVWICTDASGPGIAATASVHEVTETDAGLSIRLHRIRVIDRPIPLDAFPRLESGSALFSQLQRNRHPDLYFLDDDIFEEFEKVVLDRIGPASLPRHISWEEVISRNHAEAQKWLNDNREVPLALRPVRQGQRTFRDALMRIYDGKCVVTGCAVRCALDAAHIVPWTGDPELDRPENGLLLRRDIHALFDAGLINVDPTSSRIKIDPSLLTPDYSDLEDIIVKHHAAPELLLARASLLNSLKGSHNE